MKEGEREERGGDERSREGGEREKRAEGTREKTTRRREIEERNLEYRRELTS